VSQATPQLIVETWSLPAQVEWPWKRLAAQALQSLPQ